MKNLLLVLMLAVVFTAQAQITTPTDMYISMKDGTKTVLQLNEKPRLSFNQNEMTVTTKKAVLSFPYNMLQNITYSDVLDGLNDAQNGDRTFVFDGQSLSFNAGTEGLKVMIFGLDGTKVRYVNVKPMGSETIPADQLPKGKYVVVVNGITYKIAKS